MGIAYHRYCVCLWMGLALADGDAGITSFVILFISSCLIRDRNTHIQPDIKPFDTNLIRKTNVQSSYPL